MTKKLIALFLLLSALTAGVPCYADAPTAEANDGIMLALDNVSNVTQTFDISATGLATVYLSYTGTMDMITITFETKLQKKFLFFFWGDVANGEPDHTWVVTKKTTNGTLTHTLQLEEKGTYRSVTDITVLSSDGTTDTHQIVHEYVYE